MHLTSTYAPQCSAICYFTFKKMFSTTNKDVLPKTALSNVIYLLTCACGHKYIGITAQRLRDRVKPHTPDSLVQLVSPTAPLLRRDRGRPPRKQPTADTCAQEVRRSERIKATRNYPPTLLTTIRPEMVEGKSDSAITKHVKLSRDCSSVLSRIRVVPRARSKSHLNVLEAIFIARLHPDLCLQKEFVRSLCLFRGQGVMLEFAAVFAPLGTSLLILDTVLSVQVYKYKISLS